MRKLSKQYPPTKKGRKEMNDCLKRTPIAVKHVAQELDAVMETPEAVNRRLRQVYAELPDEVPTKKKAGKVVRGLFGTLGSVAAAFLILFGFNAVNPVMAESIPLVGGIFRQINATGGGALSYVHMDVNLDDYATPMGDATATVEKGWLFGQDVTATLKSVSFDGAFLHAAFEYELSGSVPKNFFAYTRVKINGEEFFTGDMSMSGTDGGLVLTGQNDAVPDGSGKLVGDIGFYLPDKFQTGEPLDVVLTLHDFCADGFSVNRGELEFSFTAEPNLTATKIASGSVEQDGCVFVSAQSAPGGTAVTVEYPEKYHNPAPVFTYLDGTSAGWATNSREELGNGMVRTTLLCDAPSSDASSTDAPSTDASSGGDTTKAVFHLFDKNGSDMPICEFTVDFATGTAEATQLWKDPESIFYLNPKGGGAYLLRSIYDDIPDPDLEYFVESIGQYAGDDGYTSVGSSMELTTRSKEGYRELKVEIYRNGELAASAVSEQAYFMPAYSADGSENKENGNRYAITFPGLLMDYQETITVKVLDNQSGELINEQELQLNRMG